MKIYLLTHPRELPKPTNTGKLVTEVLGASVRLVEWSRIGPDAELLQLAEQGALALIYPGEGSTELSAALADAGLSGRLKGLVVLDGTWQEARKMFNKSPYLQKLPRIALEVSEASRYSLRRNQKAEGLCTAECVAYVLQTLGRGAEAKRLSHRLEAFIEAYAHRK
ncbi:tRNA-uridine aminocarboxypropyltransferase [Aliamphritea hakodatensis]|uniref:tRNA-uridine aminocarboxypropyltransferase n=1 Tax=Aliamphritea hakodatensis TaxID=2895352 RepID=UPI0022FD54BA|nr:tRNA-uridine aminocarboxypropyltransferase [Aliamphritea hakodatensis]